MELYLLRHSDAVESGAHGFTKDPDRPLTEDGVKKMKRVARAMKKLGLSFDIILSSPYRRARETSGIVGEILECGSRIRLTPHLVVSGNPTALIREINEAGSNHTQILLVGHEPLLTSLISVLTSGHNELSVKLKKGGLCKLSVEDLHYGKCATLEWLMGPSQFPI